MFTKIKTALASFANRIAHRIYTMGIEAELAAGVADVESALKVAVSEAEKVIDKVEAAIEPAKAPLIPVIDAIPAAAPLAATAPVIAAPAVSTTDTTLAKVKDLLGIAERLPTSFDALAALASKELAAGEEAVYAKLKSYLAYAKADAVTVFDEVLAAAKVL